jgi:UDP-4-amino-4,6-dideoxy-N-acetyl-beta-L-altrosamine transaminase
MKSIPYGRQHISQEDIAAVVDVLQSDWLTQGPAVERFERAVASYCGAGHAAAVCNATAALHLACHVMELGPGDLLWTSPNTFVASANCALYRGADVDFVDIDCKTYNMCANALAAKLRVAERNGRLPKIVVPVHFSGQACDMQAIHELAKQYGFRVIEDASHAIGGDYLNKKIGVGLYSDLTVFSFHPVKIMTTGEGGMAVTNDPELHRHLCLLRSHAITRCPAQMRGETQGPWYYEQVSLGYNYRITDIQAALGLSQLRRVDEFVDRRRLLARRYNKALSSLPLEIPWQHSHGESAWHLYVIRLRLSELRKSRREVVEELRAAGVQVNVHYIPVHLQPHYRRMGFEPGHFPNAERYYEAAISLPMYFGLSESDQDYVIERLAETLK